MNRDLICERIDSVRIHPSPITTDRKNTRKKISGALAPRAASIHSGWRSIGKREALIIIVGR